MKHLPFSLVLISLFCLPQMEVQAQSNEISMELNTPGVEYWALGGTANYYAKVGRNSFLGLKCSFTQRHELLDGILYKKFPISNTVGVALVHNHQYRQGIKRRLSIEYGIAMKYQETLYYFNDPLNCSGDPIPIHSYEDGPIRTQDTYIAGLSLGVKYDWELFERFRVGVMLNAEPRYVLRYMSFEWNIQPALTIGYNWGKGQGARGANR